MIAADRQRRTALARRLASVVIVALCAAALTAIVAFLVGDFVETETRILGMSLALVAYSLTGLAATARFDRSAAWLGRLGRAVSAVGLVTALALIWGSWDEGSEALAKVAPIAFVLALSLAHAALLLPRHGDDGPPADKLLVATLAAVALLAAMLVGLILDDGEAGEVFYRLLGVVAVLHALGTILVPIRRRLSVAGVAEDRR